jgi:hypothetical protein
MCEDHHTHGGGVSAPEDSRPDETLSAVSRRRFMRIFGGSTAAGLVLGNRALPSPAQASPIDGTPAQSMAMHVHASFSELRGSMAAQLAQAEQNGIDVVWWTDHDFRVAAMGYRRAVRFDGKEEKEDGLSWTWAAPGSRTLRSRRTESVWHTTARMVHVASVCMC